MMLGAAAGLGFGISDVAIKALSNDLEAGVVGLISPWSVVMVVAAVGSFFASARSLQVGDGVAVIAVTSVAANLSTIVAGMVVFGDPLGVTDDTVLAFWYRRERAARIYDGADEVHKTSLGRRLLCAARDRAPA